MSLLDRAVRWTLIVVAAAAVCLVVLRFLFLPWPAGLPLVAHAGGGIDGQDYTNSIAAFDLSHSRGFRRLEVDLQTTSDGRHVCGHDWTAFQGRAPTFAEFLEWRQTLTFPPCTIEELSDWFTRHPDAFLVTDAKDSTVALNAALDGLIPGRLIVQAYSREELCAYLDAGMPRVILTLYRSPTRLGNIASYLGEPCPAGGRAEAITMSTERVLAGHALAAKLSTDLPVYVHTVNDCVSAWLMLMLGADSLYTDTIAPGRCQLPDT